MDLNHEIKQLEAVHREGSDKVFTMYLNTDPSDPEQQGGEWKIQFKNGMRNFEQYLEEANNKEELKSFQLVKQKVEKFIRGNEQEFRKGVIVFATADEEVWFAARVQLRLETAFFWQETPVLDQVKKLKKDYPKAGIILVQQNEVKFIESYLNEINETKSFELDLETDNWREKTAMGPGNPSIQKDNLQSRYEANKHRWYKKIAPMLDKHAKNNDWEKIYVIGEPGSSQSLAEQMNKPIDRIIQKNMLDHEESKILQEVFG